MIRSSAAAKRNEFAGPQSARRTIQEPLSRSQRRRSADLSSQRAPRVEISRETPRPRSLALHPLLPGTCARSRLRAIRARVTQRAFAVSRELLRRERESAAGTPPTALSLSKPFRVTVAHARRMGIRFLFRNPAAEPRTIRALARVLVGVTQQDLETPSGDPGRVSFSV